MIKYNPYIEYAKTDEDTKDLKTALDHEKNFKEPVKIYTLNNACPICGGELKGNDEINYYCQNCNLLFTTLDLISFKKIN
jgi:formamidopyrimidine-DNA glycosylase